MESGGGGVNTLSRLIRYKKMQIENLQAQINDHSAQEHQLRQAKSLLEQEIARELQNATPDFLPFLNAYTKQTQHKQADFDQKIKTKQAYIQQLNTTLQTLFIERKQYEILLEKQQNREKQAQNLAEFKQETDYSSYMYTRSQKE